MYTQHISIFSGELTKVLKLQSRYLIEKKTAPFLGIDNTLRNLYTRYYNVKLHVR